MAILNMKTDETRKIIHLLVTNICNRNCVHCCNKQYDMNEVPYVTDEELKAAETLCLTGGEPFLFSNPCEIAKHYKRRFGNIKRVYVYANAYELAEYLMRIGPIYEIDGLNISIKTKQDAGAFRWIIEAHPEILELPSNRLYVFDNLFTDTAPGFEVFQREWQTEFTPATDSIFRKA